MNSCLPYLQDLCKSMHTLKNALMSRKADDILDCVDRMEQQASAFRYSLAEWQTLPEEDRKKTGEVVAEIRKIGRSNSLIAVTFSNLLKNTLAMLSASNGNNRTTYGKDMGRESPASPLLVFQKG